MKVSLRHRAIARFLVFILTLFTFIISSCRHDDERPSWETGIVTPLIKSKLTIANLISDTLLQSNPDSSIKLVYENHLYNISLDSLFTLYDTSVTKIYNLDSISLLDYYITYPVSLGDVVATDPFLDSLFVANNGQSVSIPFGFTLPTTTLPINADTLFQTMTLDSGYMDISLTNGFPIDIANVNFTLKNASNGAVVAAGIFPPIIVGATETISVPLAGKTVEGNMNAEVSISTSPSVGNVIIDTSDAVIAVLNIHDLHPSTATAIFPTQNLINKAQEFKLKISEIELKEIKIKSGYVVMDLYSTLQDYVHFTYSLPSATLNGDSFSIGTVLPPAPPGGTSHFYHQYDFSGYHLDLTGTAGHDTVNTMYNVFLASVDSTGQMRTLSLTDSMYANIGFVNLIPSYVRGYLGDSTYDIGPSELPIDLFKNITGNLQLQDVKLSIATENGIGADAKVTIDNLSSYNSRTGNTVQLTGSAVSTPFDIVRATDNGHQPPVTSSYTTLELNSTNSNATAFINNLPDKLNYKLSLQTNPQGNIPPHFYEDFIYEDKLLEFNLNVEMPLSFMANDLTMSDTFDFSLNQADIERITGGTLTLLADNGFPFDAAIQVFTLDNTGAISDSLLTNNVIYAANVNSSGKVTEKKRSKLLIPVDDALIETFFNTKKMKVVVKFNTKPTGTFLKVYSDYSIDFQLTGDFNYKAN
jgi:hypothetical protein